METTLRLSVEGMVCGGCVRAIRRALESLPGVAVERVAVGEPVEIRLDETRSDRNAVETAVERAGYRPVFPASFAQRED